VNWGIGVDFPNNLRSIHVRSVLEVGGKSVILTDNGIENILKVDVRVFISCVNTTVLVAELHSTCNGLSECESRGLGLDSAQLLPLLLGHVLGNQAVF